MLNNDKLTMYAMTRHNIRNLRIDLTVNFAVSRHGATKMYLFAVAPRCDAVSDSRESLSHMCPSSSCHGTGVVVPVSQSERNIP